MSCGKPFAIEFTAFAKVTRKLDIEECLKHPETFKLPEKIDSKYALITACAERYYKDKSKLNPIIKLAMRLEPEFAISLIKFVKDSNPTYMRQQVVKYPKIFEPLTNQYGKYITGD